MSTSWALCPLMLSACARLCRIVPCAFANLHHLLFCSKEFFSFLPVLFKISFSKCLPWFVIPTIFAACDYWLVDCCWGTLTFELRWLLVGPSLEKPKQKVARVLNCQVQNQRKCSRTTFPSRLRWFFQSFFAAFESLFSVWRVLPEWLTSVSFFKVISDLSALCLPIGSLSECLRQTPSCVCWMVCNYPQASLGQSFKAPLQICCSIHRWTSVLREQKEEWEHTENENYK